MRIAHPTYSAPYIMCTVHIVFSRLIATRTRKKAGGINRVDNEGDSLGAFHLRIAAFDAGCANAAAGQAINREKGWVINRVNKAGAIVLVHPTYSASRT